MNSEWKEFLLGEVLGDYIRGPFGSSLKREEMQDKGIPVYEQQNAIYDNRKFRYYINDDKFEDMKRFKVQKNDLIISCSGTIGKVSLIKENDSVGIISQALLILRPNTSLVTPEFLYYYFSSHYGYYDLTSVSSGSVQVNVANRKIIERTKIRLPPISEQIIITKKLSSIDGMLLNQKTLINTTDLLISSIFRSWFIDFDPVKAKAEGKTPYGMDEEIAGLFPNSLQDSELGPIPAGWEIKCYSDCMNLKYGGALKSEERIDGEFPVMGSNGVVGKHNEYLVNGPGIVIGRKGNPGTVNWINEHFFPIDTTFYVQTKDERVPLVFLYHSLNFASLPWFSADTAVPGINRNIILQQRFISPPIELIEAFRKISEAVFQQNLNTRDVLNSTETLRDALLPRLISGELKI